MNRTIVLGVVALCSALPLAGQTRSEPQILLSIFAGLGGGTDLWAVERQPLLVITTPGSLLPPVYDTLRLSRQIRPGLVAGINATYFPSSHVGFLGEISLLGLELEDRCEMIAEDVGADPQQRNRQTCNDIEGRGGAANAVAFFAGALVRTSPGAVVPYLRMQAGFTTRQLSLTSLDGRFLDGSTGRVVTRGIYVDQGGGRLDMAAALGTGIMVQVTPGYQFRIEVRDHLLRVAQVAGPTTPTNPGVPPVTSSYQHSLTLLVHLDIVLERTRGRRY